MVNIKGLWIRHAYCLLALLPMLFAGQAIASQLKLTEQEQIWLAQHPIIDIGVDGNWPPVDFINQKGEHSGVLSDYLQLLSQRLGVEFKIHPGPTFKQMLQKVRQGKLKVGTTIVKTEERTHDLAFTEPYFAARKVILVRKETKEITSLKNLYGKTLAIEKGYYLVQTLQQQHPEIKLLFFESSLDAMKAVSWEQADAYIGNQAVIHWLILQEQLTNLKIVSDAGFPPSLQRFAIYRDKNWLPLQGILNKALANISIEEKQEILKRWVGKIAPPEKELKLTPKERAWLLKHPEIRLGVDPAWPPIEFVNEDGEYKGLSAEYIKVISQLLGIRMKVVTGLSWEQVLSAAQAKEVDLLPALTQTEERAKYLNFTAPYMQFPDVVFMRERASFITSLEDLAGKQVAMENGYASTSHVKQDFPQLNLVLVDNAKQALTMLSLGEVDAYIGDLVVGSYLINQEGLSNVKVAAPTPYRFGLHFGVRKDWPELRTILQKALDTLSETDNAAIRKQWLSVRYDVDVDYGLLWKVIAAAILIFLLGGLWLLQMQRQKARLQASEAQLQRILDVIPLSIAITAKNGRILLANPYVAVDMEIEKGKATEHNMMEFYVSSSEREEVEAELQAKGKIKDRPVRFRTHKGSIIEGLLSVLPIRMGEEDVRLGMLVNLTDRFRMERELAEAKKSAEESSHFKSRFLANMSHEIRTPMNAIIGMSYLALQSDLTPRQHDYIHKISTSAHSLLNIINDILDFSKIEEGKLSLETTSFKLDEVMEGLANLVTMKAEEKGIEILFSRDPQLSFYLRGDSLRLGQVLTNLTQNAIKFTEQGEILVSARMLKSEGELIRVQFSVCDTGIGIDSKKQDDLFNAFTQADGSTTRKYGGTGLGLSISKQLVELMGGEISVESILGKGSTFSFTLDFERSIECIEQKPSLDLTGLKVLVVDDNASARRILQEMLESLSFQVTLAASGQEALAELEAGHLYDLVLMDWRMPDMNGIEASRRIKSSKTLMNVPTIIMVTAYGREEVMQQADQVGLEGFLVKPVNPSLLFDTIVRTFSSEKRSASNVTLMQQQQIRRRLKGKVLLVEDHPINQQVAQELLEGFGLVVGMAENGCEAVKAVQETNFDLVLMDIQMPEMDGFEATQRIRAHDRFADLPIIAMTAHAMAGDRERCLEAGMNEHLSKPINPDALFKMLSRWLESGGVKSRPPQIDMEDEIPLPELLPGIDLQWGLQRVGGNRKLFRKLLCEFYERHHGSKQAIEQALDAGDMAYARRLAHTLQGVAGNIGAKALQQQARVLERAIINAGDTDNGVELSDHFCAAFSELFESLSAFVNSEINQQQEKVFNQVKLNQIEIRALLDNLSIMIEDGNPDAAETLRKIKAGLATSALDEQWAALHDQLEDYNFDEASKILKQLAIKLDD